MTTRIGLLMGVLCWAPLAYAQQPGATTEESPAEIVKGLHAGVSFGAVGVSFGDDDRANHFAWRVEGGYRFPLCGRLASIRLTPKVSLLATHVGGMNPSKDTYAYASLDLAVRATFAKWRIRPYVDARKASQAAELLDDQSRILNYKGSGTAWSGGVEIPISPSGRGVELGVTIASGRFTEFEHQKVPGTADLKNKSIAFHLGWSGAFTGISLPWH